MYLYLYFIHLVYKYKISYINIVHKLMDTHFH